jgi:hypothetical protein
MFATPDKLAWVLGFCVASHVANTQHLFNFFSRNAGESGLTFFGNLVWRLMSFMLGVVKVHGDIFTRLIVVATLLCAILGVGSADVLAGEQEAAAPPTERTHLLGDWGGVRSALAKHGIIVDIDAIQYYQGVVDGSTGTDDGQYGAKLRYSITLLGESLVCGRGWPRRSLSIAASAMTSTP